MGEAEREAIGEVATMVRRDVEAQLSFSRSRPMRSLEACDAELDWLLDQVLLAKFIEALTRDAP